MLTFSELLEGGHSTHSFQISSYTLRVYFTLPNFACLGINSVNYGEHYNFYNEKKRTSQKYSNERMWYVVKVKITMCERRHYCMGRYHGALVACEF